MLCPSSHSSTEASGGRSIPNGSCTGWRKPSWHTGGSPTTSNTGGWAPSDTGAGPQRSTTSPMPLKHLMRWTESTSGGWRRVDTPPAVTWPSGRGHREQRGPRAGDRLLVRVSAAVSLAGVVDLVAGARSMLGSGAVTALMGGSPEVVPDRYALGSPASLLPLGTPQFLLHGLADSTVPASLSARLCRAGSIARGPRRVRASAGCRTHGDDRPAWLRSSRTRRSPRSRLPLGARMSCAARRSSRSSRPNPRVQQTTWPRRSPVTRTANGDTAR